jgi:nucleoside-diphosphate-sugar epimerase
LNLLVGATGFVGGHLVDYLFQQGEISKGVFRMGSHLKAMDTAGVQGIEADLLDHHSLHEAVEGVDTIYSLASPNPYSDADFLRVNTEGLLNLLEVAKESGVRTFVHLSTVDVYGFAAGTVDTSTPLRPSTGYQQAKAKADGILQGFSDHEVAPRIIIIRAAKAVGSRDESIVTPILRMSQAKKVSLPPGGTMSFVHPKDIAQAMLKAATGTSKSGTLFLVKSFDSTPKNLASLLLAELGSEAEVKTQGLFGGSALTKYAAEQLRASLRFDAQPNWQELGYSPEYSLKSTCEEIVKWYRREPWVTDA